MEEPQILQKLNHDLYPLMDGNKAVEIYSINTDIGLLNDMTTIKDGIEHKPKRTENQKSINSKN